MKKLVILNQNYFKYEIGGAEHQSYLIAKEFVKYGYEVHYIFINSGNHDVPKVDQGIYLHPMKHIFKHKIFGKPFFAYYFKIIKILNEIKPDFIYHRALSAFLGVGSFYKRSNNCKLFWHIALKTDVQKLKYFKHPNLISTYFNNFFILKGVKSVDGIFVQEEYHSDQLKINYSITKSVVKIDKFLEPIPVKETARNQKNIIWVANIKPVKQLEYFLEIADSFKHIEDFMFIVVGSLVSGSYQDNLREKINNLPNVDFKGSIPFESVNDLMTNSDVFINTSAYEGGPPVTFIQAWLSNTLILSLNVDPDNVFSKDEMGIYFENDIENLKQSLKEILDDSSLLDSYTSKAFKYANKKYSLRNIEKIKDTFENQES